MKSAIYRGTVRHRRHRPLPHRFDYSLFMLYLDLDEIGGLFRDYPFWAAPDSRLALARFDRSDHVGAPDEPLDQTVRRMLEQQTGRIHSGPIRLLTHLRYFGYCFNPVSFYFCFDPEGEEVESIVAEVSNTPWGERHCYVLDGRANGSKHHYRFEKNLHVSPFMEMDHLYDWRFRGPDRRLVVHCRNIQKDELAFDATLVLDRVPLTAGNLRRVLLRFPVMTLRVISAIHWQAFKLWWKGVPFVPHPDPAKRKYEVKTS